MVKQPGVGAGMGALNQPNTTKASVEPVEVRRADPLDPAVAALIAAHVAASRAHYSDTDCHTLRPGQMEEAGLRLWAATRAGQTIAIGGLADLGADMAEIKSVFAAPEARGTGAGRAVVATLVEVARDEGFRMIKLEAGADDYAAPARALYASFGFRPCAAFGGYAPSSASVFLALEL